MCGILTVYCKNDEKNMVEINNAYEMLDNRGPDSGKIITTPHVFGFRRLAISDQTEKGMQPFTIDGISLLCNGEIFNHKKLEEEEQIKCNSLSDCECILHLYKKYGFYRTISKLCGDFAIIIVDGSHMYFCRDRIGVRPLFMGRTKSGNLALASYARALVDYCIWVKPVPPGLGHYYLHTDEVKLSTYSYPKYNSLIPEIKLLSDIRKTLIQSVKDRIMSDRPIGCLLSGGLDSSLIVSILCKLIGSENVRTYSIGIEGSEDLRHARLVADALGTKHHEVNFTPEEGIAAIPEVIKDLESYDITTIRASVGMWLLAKWISKNTKDVVLMSGEGSDELFCGYLYFHYAPDNKALQYESLRLVKNLYNYDVLRADRCVSSHGLELRVPFLDKNMVDLCLVIDPEIKSPRNGIEKYILRSSFSENYIPDEILWRKKDGMSDGISGKGKKWYEHIQDFVKDIIKDDIYDKDKYPSREAQYYRTLYNQIFPNYQPDYDYWLPKWVNHNGNPSGRILEVFKE
jgi:asparagine synthase (glutamine-hydrolysing)